MPLPKVHPQQPWRPPAADHQNAWTLAAEWYADNQSLEQPVDPTEAQLGRTVVFAKNSTGADRERGDCVQLTDYLLTKHRRWQFDAGLPDADVEKTIGIYLASAKQDKISPVQISGICWAKVVENFVDHHFVYINRTLPDAILYSDWIGIGETIVKEQQFPTDNYKWACINLSMFQTTELYAETTSVIAPGASGTVNIVDDRTDALFSPTQTEEAHYKGLVGTDDVPSGTRVLIRYFRRSNEWRIVERVC